MNLWGREMKSKTREAVDIETWRMDRLLDLCAEHGFTVSTPENSMGYPVVRVARADGTYGHFCARTFDEAVEMAIWKLEEEFS